MIETIVKERSAQVFGAYSPLEFRKQHWRSRPLFVKGGAHALLGSEMSYESFDAVIQDLRKNAPDALREREGEVVFAEAVSRNVPSLADACQSLSNQLGVRTGWFAGVRTFSDSGIGSHYDHSDNFVLQQQGTKIWTVAPPDSISSNERACRMLNVGGYGAAKIPEGTGQTYVLEPGDLLYLPLFWLHSGVSKGESLSLSVVCPAEPVQTVLLRAMRTVMTRHVLGHQAAPALPPDLEPAEEDKWNATMARTAELLSKQIMKPEIMQEIAETMRVSLMPGGCHKQ